MQQPCPSQEYTIATDTSDWPIGAEFLQADGDGKMHPVVYDGRKIANAEANYTVYEKELLAIEFVLRTEHRYIENGTTTTILTDHESLKYLETTKIPSKRLARWIEEFGEYNLEIYRPGRDAIVPDALSRRPGLIGKAGTGLQGVVSALYGAEEADFVEALRLFFRQL